MDSKNKDTSSIIFVRILHVVACIIVFFFGEGIFSPYHYSGGDGALGALVLFLIMAIQFVVVLFGLITINVVAHKKSGKLIIPSVLLLLLVSLFWFSFDVKEMGMFFVCILPVCGVISFGCDRWIERLKKKLDINRK